MSESQQRHSRLTITPRLLTRRQAAQYCGVSLATLLTHCPVRPIALGSGKRLERYDMVALDRWIDQMNGAIGAPAKNWLSVLEDDGDDGCTH
jgi:hypothetical protein